MDVVFAFIARCWHNFTHLPQNLQRSFAELNLKDYIRLVWIVGGYILLRPYIDAAFRKSYERSARKKEEKERAKEPELQAKVDANTIRGTTATAAKAGGKEQDGTNGTLTTTGKASGVDARPLGSSANKTANGKAEAPSVSLDPGKMMKNPDRGFDWDDVEGNKEASWGSHARKRQAKFVEKWEEEQARRREEEDDKDIADLLDD